MPEEKPGKGRTLSPSFVTGAIALVFLAIGYQTALFIHRAAALKIISDASVPDTVFVMDAVRPEQETASVPPKSEARHVVQQGSTAIRHKGKRPEMAERVAVQMAPRTYESFVFNPNGVSVSDLCRLGFTLKQAESIDRYRKKGGRFRRKEDFAKSFVVADSVYARLEKYIDIPLLDINAADSAAFDALPGIGGYFAAKMVEYRQKLGGYSYKEQLLEIYHMDAEKYSKFADLITIRRQAVPFRLWSMPPDSMRLHPYIRSWQTARAVELYRKNNPRTMWTVEGLQRAGILDEDAASRLSKCRIAEP